MTPQDDPSFLPVDIFNEHDNEPSEFFGNILCENPSSNTTRLYFQNLNGLCWDIDGGKWPYICEVADSIQVDIACFVETNTNTNNYDIRQKMETICQRQFAQSRLVMATSKHTTTSAYKPGGTAIMARNAITANIKSHTRDRMGRWVSMSLETSSTKRIRIISAYQVCADIRQGSNTAASQQRAQLIEEEANATTATRITPRAAFIRDLQNFIRQVQQDDEDIILLGDFNEDISTPSSGMEHLAATCGLADLFAIRLGSTEIPATYQRGKRRLDYALVSPSLLDHVRAAGYDPFGYRIPTDHRGLYIDFATDTLFADDLTPLAPADKRDFLSTTPGTIGQYVAAKMKYLTDHNFFARMTVLNSTVSADSNLAESLDRDFQRASHHAAKVCARRKQTPWSPTLAEAWAELHFYRLARSAITTTANVTPAIRNLQEKWDNLPKEPPTELPQINQGYNTALAKLKAARATAKVLREEYLERKASLYAALEERGKSKAVQRLIRAEAQHRVYNKIRYLRQNDNRSMGLSALKIPRHHTVHDTNAMKSLPDTPDHWETVTVPEKIEQLLTERNQHHFGQAEGTPFTRPPLKATIGYRGDGYAADLILSGQADYRDTSPATKLLIQHLQSRTITTLDGQITQEDVLGKLKTWKESTSTSPSGLHLGHYHCLWRDPGHLVENRIEIINQQEVLLKCLVDLLNYALKHGHTYTRWTKIVNVMLQKDPGNPRVHRLRIIHIYEADYNLLLAVKWRQALHFSEDHKLLNDGLYGSRPGRSAHDPALIEVLQNEIYRMSMKPGVNYDLDATSCYDRILMNLATLCSRRIGMARQVTHLNAATLEQARYHVKTSLGVSETYYSHCLQYPIHGTGQGSGNSPTIWSFVCSTLFDAFATQAHGAKFTNYNNTETTTLHMIGFVDDCTQRVNVFNSNPAPTAVTLLNMMQTDVQLWNDLLWTSGGALEQAKCSFHLIQTSWNADGHPFLTGNTQPSTIHICQNGNIVPTAQKSNYMSHKTLGCWINPAHCQTQTWTALREKNEEFSRLLETNYFTRSEAWVFYTAIYLPSLTYPLPLTPLTRSQCKQLDSRILRVLTPRCGYNRNMSTAIRHAPFWMGGAGFKQLYSEQGALLLQQVYKYLNSPNTQIGKILSMAVSWTQAFLGTSELFLTNVTGALPPVGPSLLLDLRQFLSTIDGRLVLTTKLIPNLLRQHDRFIMDIALNQSCWSRRQLAQINSCRRYLQAQTVADMTNLAGTRLYPHAFNPEDPSDHITRCARFNQAKPGETAWRTWRRFLQTFADKRGRLVTPLGAWVVSHTDTRHWPLHVYDPCRDQLYTHVQGSTYRAHHRFTTGTFTNTYHEPLVQAHGYPTAVLKAGGTLRPQQNFVPHRPPNRQPDPTSFALVHKSPPWEQELLQHCVLLQPLSSIMQHLHSGVVVTCSDGSATPSSGAFGLVISTENGQRLAKCRGPVPGAYSNSFRSEAYGVLATVRLLHLISKRIPLRTSEFHTHKIPVTHYLDNKSVIARIEATTTYLHGTPNQRLKSEQDVIDEIYQTQHISLIDLQLKWVKGHQDQTMPFHELPLPAQLNCEADREAAQYEHTGIIHTDTVTSLPTTPCQLIIQGKSITGKLKRRVHEAATIPPLMKYLQAKFQWDEATLSEIDWPTFTQIIYKYKSKWTTVVKHVHNISPTGHIAHRNNSHLPHECPACLAPHETNNHVIICPHQSRAQWRAKTIQKVQHHSHDSSDPYLLDIVQDGLLRFHQQAPTIPLEQYPAQYSRIILAQNAIGWDQLYRGRWSKEWSKAHDTYAERHGNCSPKSTGQSWVLSIGRLLIDQWLELWTIRNEQRHGQDVRIQQQIRLQVLTSELTELYSYKSKVCPSDRSLFYDSVDDHLAQHPSLDHVEDWISMHSAAIQASAHQATTLGIARNRILLEFPMFNPITRPGS